MLLAYVQSILSWVPCFNHERFHTDMKQVHFHVTGWSHRRRESACTVASVGVGRVWPDQRRRSEGAGVKLAAATLRPMFDEWHSTVDQLGNIQCFIASRRIVASFRKRWSLI
jgi:predicted GNAT family N-acyltransferase